MEPKKFKAMQVRAEGASGIAITTTHIDPRYWLEYEPDVDATPTAHIVLFSLHPKVSGLPVLRGRWDDAASVVDIDLVGPRRRQLAFKWRLLGYNGHHTIHVPGSIRKYAINVHIPGAQVFQGEITLGVKIDVQLEDAFHLKAGFAVSAIVVRPSLFRRVTHWLRRLSSQAIS